MVQHRMGGEGQRVVGSVYTIFPLCLEDYFPHQKVFITVFRCTKFLYFAGEGRCRDEGTDKRTDIQTDIGEWVSHFTCQHITCYMSVQCNAMKNSSIVYFSTAVGWLTNKFKKVILKNHA